MSIPVLILGNPGTGKTTSLRNMSAADTLLIQTVKKPLPFRGKDWAYFDKDKNPKGNIFVSDNPVAMNALMRRTSRKVIAVDDSNYIMSNTYRSRAQETGSAKFTEMAQDTFSIFEAAMTLPDDVRVYIFAHTQIAEDGIARFKTIGKLLDEKITIEELLTIVMRTTDNTLWKLHNDDGSSDPYFMQIGGNGERQSIDLRHIKVMPLEQGEKRSVSGFMSKLKKYEAQRLKLEEKARQLRMEIDKIKHEEILLDYYMAQQHGVKRISKA